MFGLISAVTHALVFMLIMMVVLESGVNTRGVRPRTGGVEIIVGGVVLLVGETACKTKNLNNR